MVVCLPVIFILASIGSRSNRSSRCREMHRPNLPEIPGQAEGRQAGQAGASTTPIPLRSSARYMGAEGWRPRPDSGFLDDGDPGMSTMTSDMIRARPVTTAALAIALIGAVTILGAWFFQYGLGLKPCPLCLEQRYAYYFAIPLAVMVALGDQVGASRKVLMAALDALGSAGGLLNKLQSISVVRCDEAAWRFLGLSLAGYNVIISLALAAIAAWAAKVEWQARAESR